MRFYWPIAKIDAEQRMVWGYASTEAEDDQGETVTRQALQAALDDYMRFANIREMHQASAVGVATDATIDDKGLYLAAKIVDGEAWEKVVAGVYKGFSIGGRVVARDPADRSVITGLRLTEISVVDRPANPEAVFDCWKFAGEPFDEPRGARFDIEALSERVAKRARADIAEAVAKLTGDLLPLLEALRARVEDIARTPLPPQTMARGYTAIAKRDDGAIGLTTGDDIVTALARMSDEERTLILIKAAHANPVIPPAFR
jgi:phage head maturation protease